MKTYFRLLGYARPLGQYIFPYFVFSLLASVFGIMNFTLLQPLMDVIFNQVDAEKIQQFAQKPTFSFSSDFLVGTFNYYFGSVIQHYGREGALKFVCVIIVSSVLMSNIFRYLSTKVIKTVEANSIAKMRQAVFDKMIDLHIGFFSNERKGNILSRLTTDVGEVENSVGRAFTVTFKESFQLIMYFIVLFKMSANLTLFVLITLPIIGGGIGYISRKLRENAKDVQQRMGGIVSLLDETLGGMRVVKGFNAEDVLREKFIQENQGYKNAFLRLVYRQEMSSPFSEFAGVTAVALILWYGGMLVLNKQSELSASTFLAYIVLFSQVMRPAKEIGNAYSSMQRGFAASERIIELMDTPVEVSDSPNAKAITNFTDKIEVKNVCFSYNTGKDVLKDINITIEKGKTVALVGASGGGKSTLADLIPRFYDPTNGQILMDGVDLKEISTRSLRAQMGIVTQESVLFNDSIYNNITFGLKVEENRVIEAAKIANAHNFIMESSEGYQTFIGDRGTKLSGGQRQRLSIARAILKNPPILILDEATSALDTESEKLVQEALTNLMKNRTTIVIAHRLSTIQNADEILVLHQGEIVERGTHQSLLAIDGGYYWKLNNLQEIT